MSFNLTLHLAALFSYQATFKWWIEIQCEQQQKKTTTRNHGDERQIWLFILCEKNVYCCWILPDSPHVSAGNCKLCNAVSKRLLSIWTKEIQAKSVEWNTQTAINCDTFWLHSLGTCNSSLANAKIICYCTVFALFQFVFEGNFQVQAPGHLHSGRPFNRGFFVLRVWGAYIWRGLFSEFYGILPFVLVSIYSFCIPSSQLCEVLQITYFA